MDAGVKSQEQVVKKSVTNSHTKHLYPQAIGLTKVPSPSVIIPCLQGSSRLKGLTPKSCH